MSGHQRSSAVISGHQRSSAVISCTHLPLGIRLHRRLGALQPATYGAQPAVKHLLLGKVEVELLSTSTQLVEQLEHRRRHWDGRHQQRPRILGPLARHLETVAHLWGGERASW